MLVGISDEIEMVLVTSASKELFSMQEALNLTCIISNICCCSGSVWLQQHNAIWAHPTVILSVYIYNTIKLNVCDFGSTRLQCSAFGETNTTNITL